ncbi:YveK family protein [Macrococcus animalis]|uniref:YveK family protein n=1 Tax=Macrococcus animalis TaxID=3395467 RepID=UPI0039BDFBD3
MQDSMNFTQIFEALKKGWKFILGTTILFALIAAAVSYFLLTPIYKSEATLLVNQETRTSKSNDAVDLQTNLQSITTYASIAKLPDTLLPVIDKLNLNVLPEDLAKDIDATAVQNSTLLTITVENKSQKRAVDIANAITTTMVQQDSLDLNNLKVASKARVIRNAKPVEPTPLINVGIGAVLGLLLSLFYVLAKALMDVSLKTSEQVEREIGVSVIGNIPYIK